MSVSLKEVCSAVATVLGRPTATVYEHQRELVRDGLLEKKETGVGPGSGVRATPKAVATLVIAELVGAAEGWIAIGEKVRAVLSFEDAKGITLVDALAAILETDPLPLEVWLQVSHGRRQALLTYSKGQGAKKQHFLGRGKTPSGIVLDANLYVGLHKIAAAMRGR